MNLYVSLLNNDTHFSILLIESTAEDTADFQKNPIIVSLYFYCSLYRFAFGYIDILVLIAFRKLIRYKRKLIQHLLVYSSEE